MSFSRKRPVVFRRLGIAHSFGVASIIGVASLFTMDRDRFGALSEEVDRIEVVHGQLQMGMHVFNQSKLRVEHFESGQQPSFFIFHL